MNATYGTVFLLDDEPGMLKALTRLLTAEGFAVRGFTSVNTFLASYRAADRRACDQIGDPVHNGRVSVDARSDPTGSGPAKPTPAAGLSCLVLDVAMPELNGLELQQRLTTAGALLPIVFLTGHGDIPMSVQAIKAGAVDFLTKPVNAADLLRAVHAALQRAAEQRDVMAEMAVLRQRHSSLTPREREVMGYVVAGQLNKQIAANLGTGEHTIKVHRARVMEKMGVQSLADLVRAAERLSGRQ